MAEKKISFGFSKLKKPTLLTGTTNQIKKEEVQLIQCLEGQTIKILGGESLEEKPLVIPLIENTKTSSAIAALKSLKNTIEGTEEEQVVVDASTSQQTDVSDNIQKTLEQQAAQEILNSLKERQDLAGDGDNGLVLPIKADELPLDGAKESTLDDYENIPINHFGLAMLRGMGWKDEEKKVSGKSDSTKIDGPMLRPRGMGLGADKMIKAKPLLVAPAANEVLSIKKNACVRMLSGKHKDLYGTSTAADNYNICLLDWQFSRYDSPILDVIHFIYTCTDSNLRERHFDDLLHCYHHALCIKLESFGANADELFSYRAMTKQLKTFGRHALVTAVFLVPCLFTDQQDMPDINELNRKIKEGTWKSDDSIFTVTPKIKVEYDECMSSILRHMNSRGFFN